MTYTHHMKTPDSTIVLYMKDHKPAHCTGIIGNMAGAKGVLLIYRLMHKCKARSCSTLHLCNGA